MPFFKIKKFHCYVSLRYLTKTATDLQQIRLLQLARNTAKIEHIVVKNQRLVVRKKIVVAVAAEEVAAKVLI